MRGQVCEPRVAWQKFRLEECIPAAGGLRLFFEVGTAGRLQPEPQDHRGVSAALFAVRRQGVCDWISQMRQAGPVARSLLEHHGHVLLR